MKSNKKERRIINAVSFALLIMTFLFIDCFPVHAAELKIAGGLRYNNDGIHGVFGTLKTITPNITEFISLDAGGDAGAASALTFFKLKTIGNVSFHAVLGPTIEFIDEDPEFNVIRSVLTMSTGTLFNYDLINGSSIWLGFNYLIGPKDIKQYKFGLGYTATLNF